MNPTPVIRDGEINVMLENVPANNYYLQADVYIYTDEEDFGDAAGISVRHHKAGFYVESGEVLEIPEGADITVLRFFMLSTRRLWKRLGRSP